MFSSSRRRLRSYQGGYIKARISLVSEIFSWRFSPRRLVRAVRFAFQEEFFFFSISGELETENQEERASMSY
jgi:hypothetical protein